MAAPDRLAGAGRELSRAAWPARRKLARFAGDALDGLIAPEEVAGGDSGKGG